MRKPELPNDPTWKAADQTRADAFERQIVTVAAQLRGGHPDVIVVAFVQTLGSLMVQRLQADPSRAATYSRMLEMLDRHVADSLPPAADDELKH